MHIAFTYIVLLDQPLSVQGETYRALAVWGTLLRPEVTL